MDDKQLQSLKHQYAIKKPTVLLRWVFDFQNLKLSDDSEGLESVACANHETSAAANLVLLEHVSTQSCTLAQSIVHAQRCTCVSSCGCFLVFAVATQNCDSAHWHCQAVACQVNSCSASSVFSLGIEHRQLSSTEVIACADRSAFASNVCHCSAIAFNVT